MTMRPNDPHVLTVTWDDGDDLAKLEPLGDGTTRLMLPDRDGGWESMDLSRAELARLGEVIGKVLGK